MQNLVEKFAMNEIYTKHTSGEWRTNISRYERPQSGRGAFVVESIPVTFAEFGVEF
jgi:hypothetical protein